MTNQPDKRPLLERIQDKLNESQFFLDHMNKIESRLSERSDKDVLALRYYTSAFLNAFRSVQQYIVDDWATGDNIPKPPPYEKVPKAWYDKEVGKYPVLKFIRDERNLNIHTTPAQPHAHIKMFSWATDPRYEPEKPSTTTVHQEWENYPGEDKRVTNIGKDALEAVQQLIEDGKNLGHIK